MSDSSASNAPREPGEPARPRGSSPSSVSTTSLGPPVRFDQATVISKTPPVPGPVSESARDFDLARSLEGERLNHFEVREYVGGGGMGAVYRALDTSLNRIVALKLLSRDQSIDEETVRRFRNEAQSAARLDHENIARAYYVGEDRGLHYIAFEFIEGKNIRELVEQRGGPLPLADALSYTLQVAEALAHASARDVVHRDIKPSNILITQHGRAKLVDMGLARLHQVEHSDGDLTASGVTLGTFDYISPEQARDPRSADTRSDIYSLGCTLYYMLTSRPPFPEGTVLQKLLQHQGDEPPDPAELNREIPLEVTRLMARMLAKDPAKRFQSPTDLVGALVVLGNELGLRPLVLPGYAYGETARASEWSPQRHLPWLLPVVLLLVVVGAMYYLPTREGTTGPVRNQPGLSRTGEATSNAPGSVRDVETPRTSSNQGSNTPLAPSVASYDEESPTEAMDSDVQAPIAERPPSNDVRPAAPNSPLLTADDRAREQKPATSATGSIPRVGDDQVGSPNVVRPSTTAGAADPVASEPSVPREESTPPAADRIGMTAPRPGNALPLGTASDGPGLLIVSDDPKQADHYPTLRAACQAAKSGDVIELRYNGRRIEQPIQIQNLRLTIRAGEDFAPVVTFRPNDPDPLRYPHSMISVSGRQLSLFNVGLELELPREIPADAWSLISVQQAESLRLEYCSLTIRNADQQTSYHDAVSFIDVRASSGENTLASDGDRESPPAVAVHLQNCIARGEAVFLSSKGLQPIHFVWDNGLLATTERMIDIAGGQQSPAPSAKIEVELRHLTAAVRRGLCALTASEEAPYQLPTSIHCTDCIVLASTDAALLEQRGLEPVTTLRGQLEWNGDFNFYEGFSIFRRIQGLGPQGAPQLVTVPTWRAFWGRVGWARLPSSDRPMHAHRPSDYSLEGGVALTPARRGASDGRDAGFDLELLPPLPAAAERATSGTTSP